MNIHIRRYPIFMKLGCYEEERVCGQEVFVTLQVKLAIKGSSLQDHLENTCNYAKILETLDAILEHKEMKLIETAVEMTGSALLEVFPEIEKVLVEIEKPILPSGIGRGAQISVASEYERTRV